MTPRKTIHTAAAVVALFHASMRPRHDAAENNDDVGGDGEDAEASMRPRHDAAENEIITVPQTLEQQLQ